MILKKVGIRVEGMIFNQFGQMVGCSFVPGIDCNHIPIVAKGHGLCQNTIDWVGVATQAFLDEEMMKFIIGFRVTT